ncbi:MAG: AMP-binding protein, partial [Thermoplasmata archaeon]
MLQADEAYHDLVSLVRSKGRRHGERPALRFAGRTLTYAGLDDGSDRVAAGLRRAGVGPGDRVAALLFNVPEFPLLWFGAAKAGAVLVPLNTALKGGLLRYELEDSGAVAAVVDGRLRREFDAVRDGLRLRKVWSVGPAASDVTAGDSPTGPFSELEFDPGPAPEEIPHPWDPAAILYTSGTTGPPKGAVIPHEKYLTTPREIGLRSRLDPESILFTALPLFHCNAQEMTALTALENDLTAVFEERFHASRFWESASEAGASHVSLLISMINVLYKQPERSSDRSHRVRVALTAGATREIWPRFEQRFGVELIELYGMTECGCTTLMNPPAAVRVGSVGTPLGFVEAQVVDDHDRQV